MWEVFVLLGGGDRLRSSWGLWWMGWSRKLGNLYRICDGVAKKREPVRTHEFVAPELGFVMPETQRVVRISDVVASELGVVMPSESRENQ